MPALSSILQHELKMLVQPKDDPLSNVKTDRVDVVVPFVAAKTISTM